MGVNLLDLYAKLTFDTSEYEEGIGEAEQSADNFGSTLSGKLGQAGKNVGKILGSIGSGSMSLGSMLISNATSFAEYGDNIDKMSQKMGVSSKFYQEWDAILQHSGTSMDAMKTSFKTLADASAETSDIQNEAFGKLGLSMKEVRSMSQEDLFNTVIGRLQDMEEGAERTAIASDLLGKGAVEMGALLNTSAEDTEAMRQKVNELGGVLSEDAVKAAATFQDNMQDMTTGFDSMKNELGTALMPAMNDFLSLVIEHMPEIQEIAGSVFEAIGNGISAVVTAIDWFAEQLDTDGSLINTVWDSIGVVFDAVGKTISFVIDGIVSLFNGDFMNVVSNIGSAIGSVIGGVVGMVKTVAGAFSDVAETVAEVAGNAGQNVAFFGSGEVDPVELMKYQDSLIAASESAKETAEETAGMKESLEEVGTTAEETGEVTAEALGLVSEALSGNAADALTAFQTAFEETASSVQEGSENTYTKLYSVLLRIATVSRAQSGSAKNGVLTNFTAMRTGLNSIMSGILTDTDTSLQDLGEKWETALENLAEFIDDIFERIDSHFNKVYTVNLSAGSASGSTEHFAKGMNNAYLLTGATIFGESGGRSLMGGESGVGGEIVIGKNTLFDAISDAAGNNNLAPLLNECISLMRSYMPKIGASQGVYIDKNKLVGHTISAYDNALGRAKRLKEISSV